MKQNQKSEEIFARNLQRRNKLFTDQYNQYSSFIYLLSKEIYDLKTNVFYFDASILEVYYILLFYNSIQF